MGDIVLVKPGFARHFLIPRGKAMKATKENIALFKKQKVKYEAQNLKKKTESETLSKKIEGLSLLFIRHADRNGQLYGSVNARDITKAAIQYEINVDVSQVIIKKPIKMIGFHPISINLHPEVRIDISINVYRSEEEAMIEKKKRNEKNDEKNDEN